MIYIGVDPGMSGAFVALNSNGLYKAHLLTPIVGKGARRRLDGRAIAEWIKGLGRGRFLWAIERVGSMPTDGPKQAYIFGKATGVVFAIPETLGHEITEISPKDWQRVWLRGFPKGDRAQIKASAALVASDRFPDLAPDLRVKARWGLADAALLAATARAVCYVLP